MTQSGKVLIVFVIAAMGLWGCAQGPGGGISAERIRALEAKVAKLEDDFRTAVTARDQLKKKLASVEDEKEKLTKQVEELQLVVRERDELKQQLAVRTSERDNVQVQFEQLRKGIKTLLGQAESASQIPVTTSTQAPSGGKS